MAKDDSLQAIRGIAICAVILIHSLPHVPSLIVIRPILNFCVATFIFLSGFLTSRKRVTDFRGFCKKRVFKILWPYIIWTLIYLYMSHRLNLKAFLVVAPTGGASAQLYYLIVYATLVLLTPLIFRLLDSPAGRVLLYMITPITIVIRYALQFNGVSTALFAPFFGSWLIYYLIGIEWKTKIWPSLRRFQLSPFVLCAAIGLVLQIGEGAIWFGVFGSFNMGTTQIKLTTIVTSLAVIALLMKVRDSCSFSCGLYSLFVELGNLSFGIFLSHMVFVRIMNGFIAEKTLIIGVIESILVICFSAALVYLLSRILPYKIREVIGFV